jgi:hypothetical protein
MSSIVVAGDTSGSITIAAPAVAGSGTLTLPVATDTLVGKATTDTLTNKSIAATQLTGTIAAAALPAGSVLQVVNATRAVIAGNSTSTFTTTGLTASITPSSVSSKILVFANVAGCFKATNNTALLLRLYRGASSVIAFEGLGAYTATAAQNSVGSCSTTYLDSPATTSSTTYTVYFASGSNNADVYVMQYLNTQSDTTSTITLMEIAV